MFATKYLPSLFETVEYFVPDGVWIAVTNAPGKVSPSVEYTLPEILDVVTPCE